MDNHVLQSAEMVVWSGGEDQEWFEKFALACEFEPGRLRRFPGAEDQTSYDDHLGAACASPKIAERILAYGDSHNWVFGGNNLGRFVHFPPVVRACATGKISLFEQTKIGAAFLLNAFQSTELAGWITEKLAKRIPSKAEQIREFYEPRGVTSGRCLLLMVSYRLWGTFRLLDLCIAAWAIRMGQLYESGPRELQGLYFGIIHPYATDGPSSWTPKNPWNGSRKT